MVDIFVRIKKCNRDELQKIKLYLLCLFLSCISISIHEAGHWLAATLLGYQAYVTFSVTVVNGSGWHLAIIAFAGPSTGIMIGIIGILLVLHSSNIVNSQIGYFLAFNSAFGLLLSDFLCTLEVMVLDQQILAYYLGIPEITVRLPFVLLSLAILLIILQEKRAGFSHRKSFIIFPFLFLIGVISTSLLESFLITLFFMNSILAYPIFYGYPISVVAVNFTLSILIFILYRNQISIAFNEEDLFKTETIFYD
jgi:hypothetical protein